MQHKSDNRIADMSSESLDPVSAFWLHGVLTDEMRENCITQDELLRLRDLKAQVREHNQLRDSIRDKVQRGAPFEAGELTLEIHESKQRSFSFKNLSRLLGRKRVTELRDQIKPTTCINLKVVRKDPPEEDHGSSDGGNDGF